MAGQTGRPLTLGVLLDRRIQEDWVLESPKQALAAPGVRLAAMAVARGNSRKPFEQAAAGHRLPGEPKTVVSFTLPDGMLRLRSFLSVDLPRQIPRWIQ